MLTSLVKLRVPAVQLQIKQLRIVYTAIYCEIYVILYIVS